MEPKDLVIVFYVILSIIGFFGIIALSINAFFVKGLLVSLNQVKIQSAMLLERSSNADERLKTVEKRMSALEKSA